MTVIASERSLGEAVEDFEDGRTALCGVFVAADGNVRVWVSDKVQATEQYEWLHMQLMAGATEIRRMQEKYGEA